MVSRFPNQGSRCKRHIFTLIWQLVVICVKMGLDKSFAPFIDETAKICARMVCVKTQLSAQLRLKSNDNEGGELRQWWRESSRPFFNPSSWPQDKKNPRFQLANIFFFFKLWLLDFQQFKYWISHVCIFSTAMRLFSVCVASLWKAKVGAHEPWTRAEVPSPPPGHQLPGRT